MSYFCDQCDEPILELEEELIASGGDPLRFCRCGEDLAVSVSFESRGCRHFHRGCALRLLMGRVKAELAGIEGWTER